MLGLGSNIVLRLSRLFIDRVGTAYRQTLTGSTWASLADLTQADPFNVKKVGSSYKPLSGQCGL